MAQTRGTKLPNPSSSRARRIAQPIQKPIQNVEVLQDQRSPMPQPQVKPPWQVLAENGLPGQGSAAGNRAAAARFAAPSMGGPARGGAGPIDNVGGGGGGMTGMKPGGADIDSALQGLRQQLGEAGPVRGQNPGMSRIFPPQALQNLRQNTRGMSPQDAQVQLAGFPAAGPAPWNDLAASTMGGRRATSGIGGPGSDLGFQSGGGFMAQGPGGQQQNPQQNPYLEILRQRRGAQMI